MESPCKVLVLDCRSQKPDIEQWVALARAQYTAEANFKDVFPWKKACTSNYIHFIAHGMRGGNPIICGWLSLLVIPNPKHGFIVELSTRRIKDAHYGGVGQLLNNAVVHWGDKEGLHFLQLMPLNEDVRAVYLKPEWGYVELRDDVKHLFRILHKKPSKKYLETLVEDKDMAGDLEELEEALEAYAEEHEALEPLIEKALEYVMEENPAFEDFKNAVFTLLAIEGEEEVQKESEMKQLLVEFIEASTGASMNMNEPAAAAK